MSDNEFFFFFYYKHNLFWKRHSPGATKTIKMGFLTKCREYFFEFLISVVFTKVFDVDICEFHSFGSKLHLSFLAGLKMANKPSDKK